MLARLKRVIQFDDVLVRTLLQDTHLLHQPPFVLLLIAKNGVLDRLDGDQMLGHLVAREIDFAKGASSQNSTNTIEITGTLDHVADLAKIGLDMLFQPLDIVVVLLHLLFLRVHRRIIVLAAAFLVGRPPFRSRLIVLVSVLHHVPQRRVSRVAQGVLAHLGRSLVAALGFRAATASGGVWIRGVRGHDAAIAAT